MGSLGNWMVLSPVGLAVGLAAIAIPWLIHWISRSQGKRVLIGSIQLVRQARRRLVHELRLTQWLLLVVRTFMLLVAALILGRLAMPGQAQIETDAAYVTPQWLATAGADDLEVLARFGTVRVLDPGFPEIGEFAPGEAPADSDAWPLLAERLSVTAHAGEVHVFSLDQQAEWGSFAPALPNPVTWHGQDAPTANFPTLALEVLIIDEAGGSARGVALEQALGAIRQHRLPELKWRRLGEPEASPTGDYDAVIRATTSPPDAIPFSDEQRLIDLYDEAWTQRWTGAEFPQLLLDALLSEEQSHRTWASAPVMNAMAAAARPVTVDREHLPRRSLQPWLAVILMLLWSFERWLAERRDREPV